MSSCACILHMPFHQDHSNNAAGASGNDNGEYPGYKNNSIQSRSFFRQSYSDPMTILISFPRMRVP